MAFRLQFKLRSLLIAVSLVCLLLGRYWQPQIRAKLSGPEHVTVRWRLLRFDGQDSVPCEVLVVGGPGGNVIYKQTVGVASNRGWARYLGQLDLSLRVPPGDYIILLNSDNSTLRASLTIQ